MNGRDGRTCQSFGTEFDLHRLGYRADLDLGHLFRLQGQVQARRSDDLFMSILPGQSEFDQPRKETDELTLIGKSWSANRM